MSLPLAIQFDGVARSDAVEDFARSRVEHLEPRRAGNPRDRPY